MSALLLRFKANYLEKMHGYPYISLWIVLALAKIYFFCVVLTWCKNLCINFSRHYPILSGHGTFWLSQWKSSLFLLALVK